MFYEKFEMLCKDRKITPSRAVQEMGFSRALAAKWKHTGDTPRADTLTVIAKYFGVSVADLLGEEKEKTANPVVDGLSDYDIKMLAWFHSLAPEQRKAILTLGGAPAELAEAPDHE